MNKFRNYYTQIIKHRFGSRRGALRTFWHKLKYRFGVYRAYRKIDWVKVDRLVFVCKGNICRSAYAEAIAKSAGFEAISCGISTRNDFPANEDAIRIAANRGTDLSEHKTTPAMYVIFKKTDLIVALEPWQAVTLTKNLQRRHYITLLGLWLSPLRPHVPDPYGLSDVYFNNCFDYIENAVNEIIKKIKNS